MKAIKERKTVYTSGQIAERVRAMAAEIDAFYGYDPLVAVCVLLHRPCPGHALGEP